MAYTANRVVAGFITPGTVQNAAAARGQVLENIANNQQWLAVNDCEMRSVYMGDMSNTVVYINVRMNPFATHVEFYFCCAKDIDDTATSQPGIAVTCMGTGDTALATQIAAGEDLTSTGAPALSSYEWLAFRGIVTNTAMPVGPRAIAGATTATAVYRTKKFRITVDAAVHVSAIQYRVLPAASPISVP